MEEDQLQKKKGRPKGKRPKGKKSSASQSPENSDPESGSKTVKGKKCKRGYKFCRGEKCGQMVHIHNKKCPHCEFEFEVKPAGPSQEEELLELEKQNKQSKKIKPNEEEKNEIPPLPERKVMKKSFYRDTYIINYCLLFEATQNLKERIMPEADLQDKIIYKDLNLGKMSPCSLFFSNKGSKLAEGNLDFNEYKVIDFQIKKNIKEFVFNTGLPINSISWAFRGKNNIQDEPSRTQFFAVAHSLNSVDKLKTDENAFITLKALNMESFHKFGTVYEGTDYVGIYKIDFDEASQSFGVPRLLYYMEHKGGSCMELKWLPVNTSSAKEIGVMGLLTSDGKISIYSMPNIDPKNQQPKAVTLTHILEIAIENVYFTQFAWYPLCPFDKLLIGDIVGNIYLYQIKAGDKKC